MLLGSSNYRPLWIVVGSFLIAGCLNILPMGIMAGYFQPDWVVLVLIYWCFWEPERIGAGAGWCAGIFLDMLDYGTFGKHALAKLVCGFLANRISLRLRSYPVWQQSAAVGVLIAIDTLIVAIVQLFLDEPNLSIGRWCTPLASMVMWPVVLITLKPAFPRHGFR